MDDLERFRDQAGWRLWLALLAVNLVTLALWLIESQIWQANRLMIGMALGLWAVISSGLVALAAAKYLTRPLKTLWQAIIHLTPDGRQIAAPDIDSLRLGRQLVASLVNQVYQLATVAGHSALEPREGQLSANQIASRLPLPLFILDKNQNILLANEAALSYIHAQPADANGKNIYSLLDMSFASEDTLDRWLNEVRQKVATASHTWERVRLPLADTKQVLMFDLAAYYNSENPEGYEVMLVMFDHTVTYSEPEQQFSLVALVAHELRTPITLLRGYVEALEEDLTGRLPEEDNEFLERTEAAGQQLAAFVNNVLNAARVEGNQFLVKLSEEDWPAVIDSVIQDFSLRARLAGVDIETDIAPDLPTVGVDRLSMYEVLGNLLDNAIKYSKNKGKIIIRATVTATGLIETTVQDAGIGIPASVVPNLFDKFYRSHRSRNQVGGTGLGLYLCKKIIEAHGGNIWVRSQEGQGSTFGFTLTPYAQLPQGNQAGRSDLTRVAHGWIKNHSLYRK